MMLRLKSLLYFILLFFLLLVQGCTDYAAEEKGTAIKQIPELKRIKPERPVKIKLKRNGAGDYSWDLHGDDADKVIEVNKRLKDSLQDNDR